MAENSGIQWCDSFDENGRILSMSSSHGDNIEEWPDDIRIREFPILEKV